MPLLELTAFYKKENKKNFPFFKSRITHGERQPQKRHVLAVVCL